MATNTCIKNKTAIQLDVTATVLHEGPSTAGSQTPLVGASPQSVSRQLEFSDRQSREPCVSGSSLPGASWMGGSARSDLSSKTVIIPVGKRIDDGYEHWVEGKGGSDILHCRDRRCRAERDWQQQWGLYPRLYQSQRSVPAPPPNALPFRCDNYRNFPYKNAHRFRDALYSKRVSYDAEFVLEQTIARLGPEECDFEDYSLREGVVDKVEELVSEMAHGVARDDEANPYTVLCDEVEDGCSESRRLYKRCKKLVEFYEGMGVPRSGKEPPQHIICGQLRAAVRQCFSDELSIIWELSFKTIQKIEKSCCKVCLPLFEEKLSQWKEARFHPVAVDREHLERFRIAMRANVEKGWDRRRAPFIPNGHATRRYTRKEGGNWNREEFDSECRTELVFSSGKPRVVTLYSAENTRRLAPLHYSLYDMLKKRGWLLVGDPTDKHVQSLEGASLLSFDYSSATDNIKSAYVRVAVEVLEEMADHITDEEHQALQVLANLRLDGRETFTGQPMGSVMSFPLLCIINKTVVDMALTAMLIRKEISFKEWSGHRLLVNGDDLLTREVRKTTNLRGEIVTQGCQVGLIVNKEKTLVSHQFGEINSTLFEYGCRQRKFNAASMWMDAGVEDVLGFAAQASPDGKTFRKIVRRNARTLAKQADKHLSEIPYPLVSICRKDKVIRKAITSLPDCVRPTEQGVISMAPRPENYSLSRDEEHNAMREEIERVRDAGIEKGSERKPKYKPTVIPNARSLNSVRKRRPRMDAELIPLCYVRCFINKIKHEGVLREVAPLDLTLPPGDGSQVNVILDNIRAFKNTRNSSASPGTMDINLDFVSLCC
uniref:RNA-dependent RNA polymerase n=1 Tax=Plasmopara viticola lesion associated ourmia-like virus 87 TaxID=2686561 RepID=A0A9E9C2G6_9VIRU|nr:MAG: RNA-dependent RNA polymerase [Plasmopara viticola lesion associated ourmia-like virus 87]